MTSLLAIASTVGVACMIASFSSKPQQHDVLLQTAHFVPTEVPRLATWLNSTENPLTERRNAHRDVQKSIVWYSGEAATPISVVFLHGWSASSMQVDPYDRRLARGLKAAVCPILRIVSTQAWFRRTCSANAFQGTAYEARTMKA